MAEFLYATSHITGDFANPTNAVGNTPSTWAGQLNTNTSATSRWAIGNPVDALTSGGTHTIRVVARKGSNSNSPTITLNLYENGTLVKALTADTAITSTSGQTLSGTFNTSEVTNKDNIEIEVVMTAAGGSPSARNSAQISHIEWEAATSPAAKTGTGSASLAVTATAAGAHAEQGSASLVVSVTGTAQKTGKGTGTASLAVTTTATGSSGAKAATGTANLAVTTSAQAGRAGKGTATSSLAVSTSATGAHAEQASAALVVSTSATAKKTGMGTGTVSLVVSTSAQGSNPSGGGYSFDSYRRTCVNMVGTW